MIFYVKLVFKFLYVFFDVDNLLVQYYLFSDIRHKLLILLVSLLEKALVILDFLVDVPVDIREVPSAQNPFDKLGSMFYHGIFLFDHTILFKFILKALKVMNVVPKFFI